MITGLTPKQSECRQKAIRDGYNMLVVCFDDGVSIAQARTLTDAEKEAYSMEYKDHMVYGGPFASLTSLHTFEVYNAVDLKEREWYGFPGSSNSVYEITEQEAELLISNNRKKQEEKAAAEKAEILEHLHWVIARCEAQKTLYTKEEAKQKVKEYNDAMNEGGEGFVPHFYTVDEYETAKKRLAELTSQP